MNKEKKDNLNIDKFKKEIEKIEKELKKCEKEKEEYLNGWKREKADFINYKKEEAEKIRKLIEYNTENLILKILPIVDSFNLASKEISKNLKEENDFVKGLLQIKSFLENFLKNEGVEEIKCLGELFDPFFHEAIEMADSEDESGTVIKELEKGYKIKDKLLRPAKVRVAK